MPYEWLDPTTGKTPALAPPPAPGETAPSAVLHLWPYRSLPRRGFVVFIGVTSALFLLPLMGVVGTPVLWGLLPFLLITVAAVWIALERSYRDGSVLEELSLWPDRVCLTRHNPRGKLQTWEANPHWVRVEMHPTKGPVENYVTLTGAGRCVEIGAFLSIEERAALFDDLNRRLKAR
ncbi:DUF2244 domain-containing protein [Alphaproteobacteria bacterium KMM 3653]|uniref:DUF2244 domain-containing protein n=1 Tax=Harenicola maris TaxID=2841044 RepID=A0AAP2G9X9_9RHOB|nr:DUF2244 domain-containing protein [Harenicola maris]